MSNRGVELVRDEQMGSRDRDSECTFIVEAARRFASSNPSLGSEVAHIDNRPGVRVYIRDADQMNRLLCGQARILDWGCGLGQMAWLMANRGHHVSACDYFKRPSLRELLDERVDYSPIVSPTMLDAPDAAFDAVISSGTLEHAHNITGSLHEIRRVLKPGGWLFLLRFPNTYSLSEYVAKRSGRWYHAVSMTRRELQFLLKSHSFHIAADGYDSFLPIFLGRSLRFLRPLRDRLDPQITILDQLITRIPLVANLSTSIYLFAQVNQEYTDLLPSRA